MLWDHPTGSLRDYYENAQTELSQHVSLGEKHTIFRIFFVQRDLDEHLDVDLTYNPTVA